MKTNIEYFEYSSANPEDIFDSFYSKGKMVVPKDATEQNSLTTNNEKLLQLVTTFGMLVFEYDKTLEDETVREIVIDIIKILDSTQNINYSAFTQFFMVYNSTYSIYKGLPLDKKIPFIFEITFCIPSFKCISRF